jgi:hypothetical protein
MKLQAGQNGASSTMSTPPLGLFCPPEGDFVRSSKRDSMDCGHVVPKMVKAFKEPDAAIHRVGSAWLTHPVVAKAWLQRIRPRKEAGEPPELAVDFEYK